MTLRTRTQGNRTCTVSRLHGCGSNKSLLGCALDVGFSLHQFLFARMGALVPGLVAVLSTCVLAAVEIALVRSLARMGASVYG